MRNPFVYGEVVPVAAFVDRVIELDRLVNDLAAGQKVFLISPRRYGKSSLVRSGLIPSLQSGFMASAGSSWRIAIMRPGEDPIGNLAAALADQAEHDHIRRRALRDLAEQGALADAGSCEQAHPLAFADGHERVERAHAQRQGALNARPG